MLGYANWINVPAELLLFCCRAVGIAPQSKASPNLFRQNYNQTSYFSLRERSVRLLATNKFASIDTVLKRFANKYYNFFLLLLIYSKNELGIRNKIARPII